jgi:metallo-beta-lactamase family protein
VKGEHVSYIQFLGAAGTVTGSKHLINCNSGNGGEGGFQALLDCGLFQGPKEWRLKNWQDLPVPARAINALVLTHAHLDHSGWIPRLVAEGYRGRVYATPATVDLCGILLPDSGYLQEEDAAHHNAWKSSKHDPALPLYTLKQARDCLAQFSPVEFGKTISLGPEISFRFVRSAHILGAAMTEVTLGGNGRQRVCLFTGDVGRVRNSQVAPGRILHSGPTEGESPDVLVMESTYGNRSHPTDDPRPQLASLIRETVKHGGSIVVPAFAVERTQKFLFLLKELMEGQEIPRLPVFSDSPMGIEAVKLFLKHSEEFNEETRQLIKKYGSPFQWENFHFAVTVADSKKISDSRYPCVIVSSSGMATGGRIQHHLLQRLPDPRTLVLFIGFQAEGTRGRQIKDGEPQVKIFGQIVPVRAQVAALEQFSDHADAAEMLEWLRTFKKQPEITYLVHGEPDAAAALRQTIQQQLGWRVEIARYMQRAELQ